MWNKCSVKVSSSLTCAAASQSNQCVHSYALENGVRLILLRTAMWGHVSQLMRLVRMRRCLSRIGMPLPYEFSCLNYKHLTWFFTPLIIWTSLHTVLSVQMSTWTLFVTYPCTHMLLVYHHVTLYPHSPIRPALTHQTCTHPSDLHSPIRPALTHQTCTPHVTHVQPLPTHTCTCTNLYPCPQVWVSTGTG